MRSRRVFVRSTAAALASLGAAGCAPPREPTSATSEPHGGPAPEPSPPARALPRRNARLLILGGTGFLGPHIVDAAHERGHIVTLFNRGKTNPHLFPEVEKLRGDRDGKLGALQAQVASGRHWDAVIDTSGYVPRLVHDSARLLAPAADQYLFISSISAYADASLAGLKEDAALATLDDPTVEQVTGETYGGLKALCEAAAASHFNERSTTIRPGLIVGPGDPTDRFTYWPVRAERGGEILAPGSATDPVQVIDARDLASWIVRCVEQRHHGVFNATGPARRLTMGELLDACLAAAATPGTRATWVDAAFLEAQGASGWGSLPVWVPPTGESSGFGTIDIAQALTAGLEFRSLRATAGDTLSWWNTLPEERRRKPKAGLSPEREAELLKAWHARG